MGGRNRRQRVLVFSAFKRHLSNIYTENHCGHHSHNDYRKNLKGMIGQGKPRRLFGRNSE